MTEQQHRPIFSVEHPPRPADVRTALAVIAYARDLVTTVTDQPHSFTRPDATLAEAQSQLERVMPWVTAAHHQRQPQRPQTRKGNRR